MEVEWINRALLGAEEPGDMEERLRGVLEEHQAKFMESNRAIMGIAGQVAGRIPVVTAELRVLQRRAVELQSHLQALTLRVADLKGAVSESVGLLARIDEVKQKMERCVQALVGSEALISGLESFSSSSGAGVAGFFRADRAFSIAELSSFAERLVELRCNYAPLKEIPTFRKQREEILQLETLLLATLNGRLQQVLDSFDLAGTRALASVYALLDNQAALRRLFVASQAKQLQQLWAASLAAAPSPGEDSAAHAFKAFYSGALQLVETCYGLAREAFDHADALGPVVSEVLCEAFVALSRAISTQLSRRPLPDILRIHMQAQDLVISLKGKYSALAALSTITDSTTSTLSTSSSFIPRDHAEPRPSSWEDHLLTCFKPFQQNYCQLERELLMQELQTITSRKHAGFTEDIQLMGPDIERVFAAVRGALHRWISFTNRATGPDFVFLVSEVLAAYLNHSVASFDYLRSEARLDQPTPAAAVPTAPSPAKRKGMLGLPKLGHLSHDWRYFQGALMLQKNSATFRALLGSFEHAVADEMERIVQAPAPAQGKKYLYQVFEVHQRLSSIMETFAFDTMFCFIKQQLESVPGLGEVWYDASPAKEPQEIPSLYLVEIKEYILALPERLEPFALDQVSGAEEAGQFIFQWIATICRGTMATYEQRIVELNLPQMSGKGKAQLLLDIQHIANVFRAFGLELSDGLKQVINTLSTSSPSPSSSTSDQSTLIV